MKISHVINEGMAQDEAEETNGWRAELVNQINYNTFEVKMTNTRSKESANFVVRPVDMISIGPTLQIETMDVHDLQTGQTASWTSDDPQPDGGIVYAIAMMFWDNKELQKKLWTIVDTHNTKGQDKMPGLDQRRSIGQEVDADAYIDSQEKTQAAMAKMKKGMTEAEKTAKIFHPQYVDVYFLDGPRRTPLLVNRKVPYNLIDRYLEVAIKKYNLQKSRFEFRNAEENPVTEEFRPTTGQAMGIRSQIAQKMNPDNNKFIWKRPNQIMGSHTENELRALKFRYSAKHNAWGGTQQMWSRLEGTLKEFAPGGADRGGGNYFKSLAQAWYYNGVHDGDLQGGVKSQQDVERLLQRGIVCPDGVTRKFGIDYNSGFNGVVISSDDYYEHSDHGKKPGTMIDVRTGRPWGPYDYMEFSEDDLDEDVAEGIRVPAQQILGTKNRAKSAYYPTNVKPKVPRLDTPLTDKELTRLSQLAGINTNK